MPPSNQPTPPVDTTAQPFKADEDATTPPPEEPKRRRFGQRAGSKWSDLTKKARIIASVATLFLALIAVGAGGGYWYQKSHEPAKSPKTNVTSLTDEDLSKLSQVGNNLGTSGQTLSIGANALFRSKADITGDLTVGGRFNANGPVTLSQLNISGGTGTSGLNVGTTMNVTGPTTLQSGLTAGALSTFNGGLNAGGSSSFNALTATTLAVRNLSISGPLTISHIGTTGPTPAFSPGSAVGGGGTGSISGNDTAGTVNFNTGSSPGAGILGTVTFRAPYSGTVHVLLSPITGAAAATPAYVVRSGGSFQIRTDSPAPGGSSLGYDYFVTQ